MKKISILLFACFIGLASYAQSKKFIVKHNGDTVFSNTIKVAGKSLTNLNSTVFLSPHHKPNA
jgi:hypothetical protein